jgi:hypothetical protein
VYLLLAGAVVLAVLAIYGIAWAFSSCCTDDVCDVISQACDEGWW